MKTIFTELKAADVVGAIFEWGSDPCLIETEEEAEQAAEIINVATIRREITDADEFADAMKNLDLTELNEPRHIYSFVNGSEGSICFADDFTILPYDLI